MKKIKYLILGLVFAFVGLSSFSSAGTYTYTGHITSTNSSQRVLVQLPLPIIENKQHAFNVVCSFSNYTELSDVYTLRMSNTYLSNGRKNSVNTELSSTYKIGDTITYSSPNSKYYVYFSFTVGENVSNLSYDYSCTINGDNIIDMDSCSGGGGEDCSTCESSLEALSGAYSTLSGYYSSCQSSLDSCQSGLSGYSECQSSLTSCLEDSESLENMNQSLSDELQSCLESGGNGCNPEIDTGCVEGAVLPLLSWSVGLDSFSTPIINNLTLPTNYKGKLVDGVLSISSINQNLSIDDSDYGNIKDSFVNIVLYIFGVGLMLVLVYYIKFYFFNIKD